MSAFAPLMGAKRICGYVTGCYALNSLASSSHAPGEISSKFGTSPPSPLCCIRGETPMRLDYDAVAPEATKALAGVNAALLRAGLDKRLMDLLFLRVSQINGCSYCVDVHARDLRQAGESNQRLDGLAGWRESPYFTEAEKAALEWAEVLTHV